LRLMRVRYVTIAFSGKPLPQHKILETALLFSQAFPMTVLARQFWKISAISFISLSLIYIYVPILRKPLTNEDNLLEMASALMYLAATVLTIKFLAKRGAAAGSRMDWLIPLLPMIGFAEEVSLGRLFFSEIPLVDGVKIDAAHDFLRVFLAMLQSGEHHVLIVSILSIATVATIVCMFLFKDQIAHLLKYEPMQFCLIWFGLIAFASVVDLDLVSHFYLTFLEEYLETLAALSLVFAYHSLKRSSTEKT
jgi:hypothetical protein